MANQLMPTLLGMKIQKRKKQAERTSLNHILTSEWAFSSVCKGKQEVKTSYWFIRTQSQVIDQKTSTFWDLFWFKTNLDIFRLQHKSKEWIWTWLDEGKGVFMVWYLYWCLGVSLCLLVIICCFWLVRVVCITHKPALRTRLLHTPSVRSIHVSYLTPDVHD